MKKEFRDLLREHGRDTLPNVLLVSAECAPLSKTGGLADVVGTLPKSLAKLGIDARVITPYHRCIKDKYADKVEHKFYFYAKLGWRQEYVGIEKLVLDGVTIYLVDNEQYFGDKIYRGGNPEGEQYSFFCRAVLDAIPNLGFDVDVVHCNDWHTAMIPMLARTQYRGAKQEQIKYLLTIHNIAFQGKFGFDFVQDMLDVDSRYYTPEFMELNGCADYLKAGCVFADRINTVSPSYASEIKMPYYAEGLEGILNARSAQLTGIINGIDKKVYNPHGDALLPARYDRGHLKGKAVCKAELQRQTQEVRLHRTQLGIAALSVILLLTVLFLLFTARMNRRLAHAKRAAEASSRMKGVFIRNITHEINTPLNSIVGFAELAAAPDADDEERQSYIEIIRENSGYLQKLVDDVLYIAGLESSDTPPALGPVDINVCCMQCIQTVRDYSLRKLDIRFEPECAQLPVNTSCLLLSKALTELLRNAARFAPDGRITLAYTLISHKKRIAFTVTDRGPGIPAAEAGRIFDRFVKLDPFSQGMGLGLAVCRLIAGALGGGVELDTSYTEGARFTLTIPIV